MSFALLIGTADTEREVRGGIDFLARQALSYPGYDAWVQRAEHELLAGYKHLILSLDHDRRVVGNALWQPEKSGTGLAELKNLRVAPGWMGRGLGRFLLEQVKHETRGYPGIICDTRPDPAVEGTLLAAGFSPLGERPLYDNGVADRIYVLADENVLSGADSRLV